MDMYNIIEKKRDKKELTELDIDFFIKNYTENKIEDYQAAALLMAIYLNGMNYKETLNLTKSMINSGDILKFNKIKGRVIDKHSTGGVGDTVTLILGPMVAAAGIPFAKMSGKGLGHTGGTIDKLTAIPGINLELSHEEFQSIINNINIAISGQTGNLAPADKKIYSLRDATATVDNIPLIASSIMSKKIATGADGIVLDVKVGSGAFMKTIDKAEELAKEMVSIGRGYGIDTVALITDMDEPLGYAIGNNIELIEAIETLKGNGPSDLYELCLELGVEILLMSGKFNSRSKAKKKLKETIVSGEAYKTFIKMVELQGGDISYIKEPNLIKKGKHYLDILSKEDGYISHIDAEKVGNIALKLGAGREKINSEIDLTAGVLLNKKVGDRINIGESLCRIYTNSQDRLKDVEQITSKAFKISKSKNDKVKKLIYKNIR